MVCHEGEEGGFLKRTFTLFFAFLLLLMLTAFSLASNVNLTADKVLFYPDKNLMKAFGNVKLIWRDKRASADSGWLNFKTNDASLEGNVFIEDKRGKVSADKVSFISALRLVRAEGNVFLITKEGIKLKCGELEAYENGIFKAKNNPIIKGKNFTLKAGEITLKGREADISFPVYMGDAGRLSLSANKAHLIFTKNGELEKVNVSGKVFLSHRKGNSVVKVKGDEGIYDLKRGKIRVSGKAVALKGKTEIRADEIVYDVKTGIVRALGKTRMIVH